MKSLPTLDYSKLAQEKPIGKYGNIKNYLRERTGIDVDDATLDKKLRTFFEDLITEILKNPTQWDRTRNINFMELFNYLGEELPTKEKTTTTVPSSELKGKPWELPKELQKPEFPRADIGKIAPKNEQ